MPMNVYRITGCEKISVSATAKDVAVDYRSFILENPDASVTVYFKEKEGKAVTAATGFALPPGQVLPVVLTGKTLSVLGSGSGELRLLYVDGD